MVPVSWQDRKPRLLSLDMKEFHYQLYFDDECDDDEYDDEDDDDDNNNNKNKEVKNERRKNSFWR